MNLLLIEGDELGPNQRVTLTDRRAEHLKRVIGVQIGQTIRAGIVGGSLAEATVIGLEGGVELSLRFGDAPPVPLVDLVLALPRPKALPRIVQAAASFGIRRIDIINAWRVDASYFSSHKVSGAALALDARLGCEQGCQTHVPAVAVHRFFAPFLEEVLRPRLAEECTRRLLVFHPTATMRLEEVVTPATGVPVVLAVGPDGGFVDREIESLLREGGTAVSCGAAVLRSEIAVVAILAQVDLLRRLGAATRESA